MAVTAVHAFEASLCGGGSGNSCGNPGGAHFDNVVRILDALLSDLHGTSASVGMGLGRDDLMSREGGRERIGCEGCSNRLEVWVLLLGSPIGLIIAGGLLAAYYRAVDGTVCLGIGIVSLMAVFFGPLALQISRFRKCCTLRACMVPFA